MRFQLSDSWSAHDFVGAATQFYDGKVECVGNPGELCIVTLANGLNPDYLQKMRQNRLAYAIGNGYSFCFSSFVSAGRAPLMVQVATTRGAAWALCVNHVD